MSALTFVGFLILVAAVAFVVALLKGIQKLVSSRRGK